MSQTNRTPEKKNTRWLWVVVLLAGLISGCTSEKTPQTPPSPSVNRPTAGLPTWRPIETSLSQVLLGTADGKCEWEVWGWHEQERYLWAFCQAGPGFDAEAVSLPVVAREIAGGTVEIVKIPEEGANFEISVKRLFPPAVQEKILANEFDLAAAAAHLAERWNYPSMPPSIYARSDDPLPTNGGADWLAVSAATAGRIMQYAVLGDGNIKSVQYLPDGQILVSGDRGMAYLDIVTGRIEYQFQDLLAGRKGFPSDDAKYVAVTEDQILVIYEMVSQSILTSIDTSEISGVITKAHFLPDGMTIIVEKMNPASEEPAAQIGKYQLSDGKLLDTWWIGGRESVISPDGKVLVGLFSTWQLDVWSVYTAEHKYTLQGVPNAVSFSDDGQIMAVASLGKVRLYWVWDGFEIGSLQKGVGNVSGIALSPDGKLVLTWSDGSFPARLWTVPDFQPVATLDIQGVSDAAFNQNGSLIVLVGDSAVAQYHVNSGEFISISSSTFSSVADLSFAPERTFSQGQRLAAMYGRGVVVNWDLQSLAPLFTQQEYAATSMVYARESYGIAAATVEKTVVMLNPEDGSAGRTFTGFTALVKDLAVNSTNQLAAGSLGEIRIFSLADQEEKRGRKVDMDDSWVEEVIWPCHLIVKTAEDRVKVLDESGETVEQVLGLTSYEVKAPLAVNFDCSQLWAANYVSIYRWDTGTWAQLQTWKVGNIISGLAVSQDDSLAAVGLVDGSILLLDSESGETLGSLKGHVGQVTALEFSPDGRFLASGGSDGVIILWAVK